MYMKLKSLVGRSLVGVACMSFMLGSAAMASDNKSESKAKSKGSTQQSRRTNVKPAEPQVILVYTTASRIPQRVVLSGTQVNTAMPLRMIGRNELLASGAITVSGILLSTDPDITIGHHR